MPVARFGPWLAIFFLASALLTAGAEREFLLPPPTARVAEGLFGAAGLGLLFVSVVRLLAGRHRSADLSRPLRPASGFGEGIESAETLALSTVDKSGIVKSFSAGATALFGFRPEEILGRPVAAALGLEPAEFLAELDHVFASGRSHPARRTLVSDWKGRRFEALVVMFPIRSEGKVSDVGLLHLDPRIPEGAEGARVRLFDSAPVGLLRIDSQGRIQAVNRRFCDWIGRRFDALEGSDARRSDVLPEALRARISSAAVEGSSSATIYEEEILLVSPDGVPKAYLAILVGRPGGGADIALFDGAARQRMRSELDAARAALAVAREAAAETIESTHRDLTTSVSALMTAFETARDEKSGPIIRAKAEVELEKSGRRLLAQVADAGALPRREGASVPSDDKRRPRVLLVDDNDENRELIAHMLTSRGAEVVSLGSGREAVDAAARSHFDLVLLDVQMPEMDGYQVVRRLRSLPGGDELPVVALTALTSDAIRDRCVAEGMDDFLSKPVTLAVIGGLLARWGTTRRSDGRESGDPVPRG